MKNKSKKVLRLILMITLLLPLGVFANSAEPPSIILILKDPEQKVTITLLDKDSASEAKVSQVGWERHFQFYKLRLENNESPKFLITTERTQFTVTTSTPLETYRNIFTLNLEDHSLVPGTSPLRDGLLIGIRLCLTLLIEGAVFYLFGFRTKRSWLIFLGVNLLTQGALNFWLNGYNNWDSYILLTLIFGEFFVFITESFMIGTGVTEKTLGKRLAYVWSANLISLGLGGYLITVLPL